MSWTLKGSFDGKKKEHGVFFTRSQVPEPFGSVSPVVSCLQEFIVTRGYKMYSPLVSRKGNREYDPAGARIVLFVQSAGQLGLVENSAELRFQEGPSMDRARSQGRVQKGSSLCAETYVETFGAEICRPSRFGFRDSRSSQGQTNWEVLRPCSGGRAIPLQIKGSHSSGKGKQ